MKLKSAMPKLSKPRAIMSEASCKQQSGFTLIEFVVASALGLMIILAIGGAYVATQKVNQAATMRVDRQQELRLASNLLVRDARMAGTFGCANVAALTESGLSVDHSSVALDIDNDASYFNINVDANDDRVFATRIVSADSDVMADIDANFEAADGSDVVIFNYGINPQPILTSSVTSPNTLTGISVSEDKSAFFDSANDTSEVAEIARARVVLSSCQRLDVFQRSQLGISNGSVSLPSGVTIPMYQTGTNIRNIINQTGAIGGEGHFSSQATLSNLYTVAYVVGKAQGDSQDDALYRFELQNNGKWTPPQLLARSISSLEAEYVYINNCKVQETPVGSESYFISQAAFLEKNDGSGQSHVLTPAGVQLKLTPSAMSAAHDASEVITGENDLKTMVLNAAMRGADACIAK